MLFISISTNNGFIPISLTNLATNFDAQLLSCFKICFKNLSLNGFTKAFVTLLTNILDGVNM